MKTPDTLTLYWLLLKLVIDTAVFMYLIYRLRNGS
jgi:hypothetical protein